MTKQDYIKNHKKSGLKVGDTVMVVKKAIDREQVGLLIGII